MGSQIANIHDIKLALKEAGQFYLQLHRLGANITTVDAGGGLGVDYDGSGSRGNARSTTACTNTRKTSCAVLPKSVASTACRNPTSLPNRAGHYRSSCIADHQCYRVESLQGAVDSTAPIFSNISEAYHNAQFDMAEARARFVQGDLSLPELRMQKVLCQPVPADPARTESGQSSSPRDLAGAE